MDKKESKTAEVNGCKSKIGKVRKWKGGGKCRRIRISLARTYDGQESPERVFRSYCYPIVQTRREKKRRGELKIDWSRPSPRETEKAARR